MLDKVLKAWECCDPFNRRCFECPYEDDCFHDNFDRVAIADMVKLLKEQQRKKGHWQPYKYGDDTWHQCSVCGVEDRYIDIVKTVLSRVQLLLRFWEVNE